MEQEVYWVVAAWLVDFPATTRHAHLPRWMLGGVAYDLLHFSGAATSPSRSSAFGAATRLFFLQSRADVQAMHEDAATSERRIQRALMRAGLQVDPRDTAVTWVRQVAREFMAERAVSRYARGDSGRGDLSRAQAVRLHRMIMETQRMDVDSASESEEEAEDGEEDSSEGSDD